MKPGFAALTKLSSDWYWRQDENLRFTHIWSEVENHGYTADSSIGKTRWGADRHYQVAEWYMG